MARPASACLSFREGSVSALFLFHLHRSYQHHTVYKYKNQGARTAGRGLGLCDHLKRLIATSPRTEGWQRRTVSATLGPTGGGNAQLMVPMEEVLSKVTALPPAENLGHSRCTLNVTARFAPPSGYLLDRAPATD